MNIIQRISEEEEDYSAGSRHFKNSHDAEVIAALHATATTHDNRGSAEVRAVGFAQFLKIPRIM